MFSNKAVGFDQGRSLREVIPRIDELLADPAAYLAREEVRIRRDPVAWMWFFLPTLLLAMFVPSAVRQQHWDTGAWAALVCWVGIIGLVYGIVGYWAWPVRLEIILSAPGVAIHHGHRTIRAPWALFATSGAAVVGPVSFAIGKVISVPVNPVAVPQVELHLDGQRAAAGRDVQTRVFRVFSEGEIQITDWFEANPTQLGTLLLMLGNAIARPADAGVPADTAIQAAPAAQAITATPGASPAAAALLGEGARWQAVSIDRAGWLRVPLTRLVFPRICCNCCRPTGDARLRAVAPALPGLLGPLIIFTNEREKPHLQIPWCGTCFHQYRKRWWGGGLFGALGGAVLGLVLGALAGAPMFEFVLGFLFGVVGMGLGSSFADRPPFEAKHHVKEQKIAFRFTNPAFAHELMEAVQKSVEA